MSQVSSAKRAVLAALALVAGTAAYANAGVIAISNPGGTTQDIGARIRWGATGFEASVYDNNVLNQNPTLNPTGTPFWVVGTAYKFAVSYSTDGTLSLSIDFNGDQSFGTGESISRTVFAAPGLTSYSGYGFKYLSISGNESGSTGRSNLSNLVINGDGQSGLAPAGSFVEQFYKDSTGNPVAFAISGSITFTTTGTGQERPAWDFRFRDSALTSVPDGGTTVTLLGAALMGLGALRRKFRG